MLRKLLTILLVSLIAGLACGEAPDDSSDDINSAEATGGDGGKGDVIGDNGLPKADATRLNGVLGPGNSIEVDYGDETGLEGEVVLRDFVEFDLQEGETANFDLQFYDAVPRCPCPRIDDYNVMIVEFDDAGELIDGFDATTQPEMVSDGVFEMGALSFTADHAGKYGLMIDATTVVTGPEAIFGGWTLTREEGAGKTEIEFFEYPDQEIQVRYEPQEILDRGVEDDGRLVVREYVAFDLGQAEQAAVQIDFVEGTVRCLCTLAEGYDVAIYPLGADDSFDASSPVARTHVEPGEDYTFDYQPLTVSAADGTRFGLMLETQFDPQQAQSKSNIHAGMNLVVERE